MSKMMQEFNDVIYKIHKEILGQESKKSKAFLLKIWLS